MTMPATQRQAFSLVEVMIAVLIIGATMTPLFYMFTRSSSGTVQSRDEVIAYSYAGEILEICQVRGFDDPLLTPGNDKPVTGLALRTAAGATVPMTADPRFTRRLHVKAPAIGGTWPFEYKVLIVEISWKSGEQTRTVQMTGMVSKVK